MTPHISTRAQLMPASPIRKLSPLADDAKRRGIHVYHLNIGQPDIETPEPMRARLAALEDKVFAYTPSGGTPEYVRTIQEYYHGIGIELGLEDIMGTTGGSEALLFSFVACAGHGDDLLVVEPFYTNYASFAALAGVRLVPLTARAEDGFHLPPREAWEKALTPRTKLVVLCNPNNPTGTVYSREEVEAVARFCRDHGLFLVSDEVYREFVYDGRKATSALSLRAYEDLVVVTDSLSKRYSACGIRLGSLISRNHDVVQAALRMGQGRLSAPGLAQVAALGAREVPPEYFAGVAAEYQRRRDLLFEGVSGIPGVLLRKPEGAFYFVARLPVADAEDFARWLLSDFSKDGATVMVSPAEGFYATPGLGRDEIRIAYVLKLEDLRASVAILREGLAAYRKARSLDEVPVGAGATETAGRFGTPPSA